MDKLRTDAESAEVRGGRREKQGCGGRVFGSWFCGELRVGHGRWWRFTHLSDDEAVAKMGHPALWLSTHVSEARHGAPGFSVG